MPHRWPWRGQAERPAKQALGQTGHYGGRAQAELGRHARNPSGQQPLAGLSEPELPIPAPTRALAPQPQRPCQSCGSHGVRVFVGLLFRQVCPLAVAAVQPCQSCGSRGCGVFVRYFVPASLSFCRGGSSTDRICSSPRPEGSLGAPVVFCHPQEAQEAAASRLRPSSSCDTRRPGASLPRGVHHPHHAGRQFS